MVKSIECSKRVDDDCFEDHCELNEHDFYPPEDNRLYCSGIDDVVGGDSYDDYAKWFWKEFENDIYN